MGKCKSDGGVLAASCLVILVAALLRFAMVAALTWLVAACVGFDWSWGLAVTAWAALILLRMAFGGGR